MPGSNSQCVGPCGHFIFEVIGWTEKFGQRQIWRAAIRQLPDRFRKCGHVRALQIAGPNEFSNLPGALIFRGCVTEKCNEKASKNYKFFSRQRLSDSIKRPKRWLRHDNCTYLAVQKKFKKMKKSLASMQILQ